MNNKKIPIAAVVGPTASGKTALAIRIALKYNGEIISADSMQIYKGMDIATAKPTAYEMSLVRHHLVDFLDPGETFSVSDYVHMAHKAAADIFSRGKLPVLCGGTGLYVRSFLENVKFCEQDTDPELRNELEKMYEKLGAEKMLRQLAEFDPQTAASLLPSNRKRIIRAFEIYRSTGITMSEQLRRSKCIPSPYKTAAIGLCFHDRQRLYDRINKRVDIMLEQGLLDEAKKFYEMTAGTTASAAIGYKELLPYLEGRSTLDECTETLKRETRRYAKRQLTWFRRDEYIKWIEADICEDTFSEAQRIIEQSGII